MTCDFFSGAASADESVEVLGWDQTSNALVSRLPFQPPGTRVALVEGGLAVTYTGRELKVVD